MVESAASSEGYTPNARAVPTVIAVTKSLHLTSGNLSEYLPRNKAAASATSASSVGSNSSIPARPCWRHEMVKFLMVTASPLVALSGSSTLILQSNSLPISLPFAPFAYSSSPPRQCRNRRTAGYRSLGRRRGLSPCDLMRSEEHTSELQSRQYL